MKLVIITGLSGAGKTVALRALEDEGFEAIDNLPLTFLPLVTSTEVHGRNIAITADVRSRDFSHARFMDVIAQLRDTPEVSVHLLYLDCDDEILQRRFTETRRRHPLADDRPIADGIHLERALLEPVRESADMVVDTTGLSVQELRRTVIGQMAEGKSLAVSVMSFSFKKGLPREADLVFDVRFLRNPHYDERLRNLTGRTAPVGEYIADDPHFEAYFSSLTALLLPLLPRYREEGKSYLTIALGCTGGKHRSVFVAEKLAGAIQAAGYPVLTRHRDS